MPNAFVAELKKTESEMDEVEKLARKLCVADGYDPDATETYRLKNHVGVRAMEEVDCKAPPYWEAYTVKARKILGA